MYDYYGIYASCRDAAWRCQLDFGINKLPVSILEATRKAGIRVVKNSQVHELRCGESGAGIYCTNRWVIVYDDALSPANARFVIAHELGHIILGHEYKYSALRFSAGAGKLKSEREADMFAIRLLAPACVLHELGVTNAADIEKLCNIPHHTAVERSRRMALLEKRNSFYRSPLEKDVLAGFSDFIDKTKA